MDAPLLFSATQLDRELDAIMPSLLVWMGGWVLEEARLRQYLSPSWVCLAGAWTELDDTKVHILGEKVPTNLLRLDLFNCIPYIPSCILLFKFLDGMYCKSEIYYFKPFQRILIQ